jgi:hypothetical protein
MFMVFAAVCGFVVPEGRMKSAVSLVMGFMLMLLILRPVNAVLRFDFTNIFNDVSYTVPDIDTSTAVIGTFERACENMLSENGIEATVKARDDGDGIYISEINISDSDKTDMAARLCGVDISVINVGGVEYNEAD